MLILVFLWHRNGVPICELLMFPFCQGYFLLKIRIRHFPFNCEQDFMTRSSLLFISPVLSYCSTVEKKQDHFWRRLNCFFFLIITLLAVFRIRASCVRIRIQLPILLFSSVTFKTPTQKRLFLSLYAYSFLKVHLHYSLKVKSDKKVPVAVEIKVFLHYLLVDGRIRIRQICTNKFWMQIRIQEA